MPRDPDARRDLLSGGALLLLGGAYLLANRRYPLETLANPGPGVFPLAAAVLLLALVTWQLARAGRALLAARRAEDPGPPDDAGGGAGRAPGRDRNPSLMLGTLVAYLMVVGRVGFLASTFILVVVCSRLMGTRGWRGPIALALGVVLCCYLLFVAWLKVPLPTGYLI